jgi:hypothetical protein
VVKSRAAYQRGYDKAWKQARRARLIEMLGGACVRCGATEDLEFDHIDPSTKVFAICAGLSKAWDVLVAEALLVLELPLPGVQSGQRPQERCLRAKRQTMTSLGASPGRPETAALS